MFLHEVEAEEYKGFSSIKISFDANFTILCGPNGVGKSTVLFAIASALVTHNKNIYLNENSQVRILFTGRDGVKSECGFGRGSYMMESSRQTTFKGGPSPYQYSDGRSNRIYLNDVGERFSPLFIGPNRNIFYKKISGMTSETSAVEYRKKYLREALDYLASSYSPEIKQWMINRYFIIDKDWAEIEKRNWNFIISNLDYIFGEGGRFSFYKIDRELEPSFKLDGNVVYLEDLSSGFKSILSIVFSIVEWIEKTNDGDYMLIDKATGVVLIDELDAHLHPSWQTKIKSILQTIFPKLQFIITTHSPHIISSAEANEVIILKRHDGKIVPFVVTKSLAAWKTDDIYSSIMGVDTVHQKTLNKVVSEIEELIDENKLDDAVVLIEEYSKKIPDSDPTALTLRKRINSLILSKEKEND
ncbi:TPA: AAA family ATPase [Yersinia enterocolitica]|uniref:AAA family ATPase n=1 Tax=Yersinia enterocolitica TaxID=630 RepID=UPI0006589E52|nr:AAA family ATPase [Yersinia enterocolitica]UYK00550.1 AAA family ATPase [Yersinia enterocolitica]CRX47366.1 putative ATP binding protein SugR [Yersinia enterocolitica]HDL6736652.1 AAA family ATPase [Yersinia enterocolitica]HDL7722971.1 AAA family ATPase [Yersinia enterocolitica]HEI6905984.1 AAA family ATPase [Yersinia enterocolitica]